MYFFNLENAIIKRLEYPLNCGISSNLIELLEHITES